MILHFKGLEIDKQLELEELLLKEDDHNWFIINDGTLPAIVLGKCCEMRNYVDEVLALERNIPIVKRFSGGGTVFVDEATVFTTFIISSEKAIFPEEILRRAYDFYRSVFGLENFLLLENDFVIGNRKCGGNAMYIRRNRYLLHTSFLWNFQPKNMNILLYPPKSPTYRQNRLHGEFLCSLYPYFQSREELVLKMKELCKNRI